MSSQPILAQQAVVRCAVRDAFRHDRASQMLVAAETEALAALFSAEERLLLLSDIESELSYDVPADIAGVWDAAHTTLRRTDEAGTDSSALILVSESLLVGAVRYAAGRQTNISSQVAEEVLRVAPQLSTETAALIAGVLEPYLLRVPQPIMSWDDAAPWKRALTAVLRVSAA